MPLPFPLVWTIQSLHYPPLSVRLTCSYADILYWLVVLGVVPLIRALLLGDGYLHARLRM